MYMGMLERLSPWQLFAFSFWCCLCDSSHCSFLFIWERSDKHTSEAGHSELSNYVLLVEFIEGENCWSVLIFASFYLLLGVCSIALLSTTNHFLFACLFFFFQALLLVSSSWNPLSPMFLPSAFWPLPEACEFLVCLGVPPKFYLKVQEVVMFFLHVCLKIWQMTGLEGMMKS